MPLNYVVVPQMKDLIKGRRGNSASALKKACTDMKVKEPNFLTAAEWYETEEFVTFMSEFNGEPAHELMASTWHLADSW